MLHECVVTIVDDDRPRITGVDFASSPADGVAYRAGDAVDVAVRLDRNAEVEGSPLLGLYLGDSGSSTARDARYRGGSGSRELVFRYLVQPAATYRRGSGTGTLVFSYTVRPGDMDSRGIMLARGTEITGFCGSGTIKAHGTDVQANPWYPDMNVQPKHKVDTEPPAVSAVSIVSRPAAGDAYTAGEIIIVEVAFSEEVMLGGLPYIELDIGGQTRHATIAASLEASSRIPFAYQVQSGDTDCDGVAINANSLRLNGGDAHDPAGNPADLSFGAVETDPDQRVSTSTEEVAS